MANMRIFTNKRQTESLKRLGLNPPQEEGWTFTQLFDLMPPQIIRECNYFGRDWQVALRLLILPKEDKKRVQEMYIEYMNPAGMFMKAFEGKPLDAAVQCIKWLKKTEDKEAKDVFYEKRKKKNEKPQ